MVEIISAILSIIENLRYIGIFIGMTIESSFFPFPSEVIMIPAGTLVFQGKLNFFLVFISGVLGSIVGALINYSIGLFLGRNLIDSLVSKYGKFLFLNKEKLKKADLYFQKHGDITTFIGRLIPGVRQLISLPAGFAKMNIFKFIVFTAFGAGIWVFILTYAGFLIGKNILWLKNNLTLVSVLIAILVLVIAVIFFFSKRKKRKTFNRNF